MNNFRDDFKLFLCNADQAESRLNNKKLLIEELEYERGLIEKDNLKFYASNLGYQYLTLYSHCEPARDWLTALKHGIDPEGKKLDKRRAYPERDSYNLLCECLNDLFQKHKVEVKEIINCNFGEAWELNLDIDGYSIELTVPVPKNVSLKSYTNYGASSFKLTLRFIEGCVHTWIGDTYDPEELVSIFELWCINR